MAFIRLFFETCNIALMLLLQQTKEPQLSYSFFNKLNKEEGMELEIKVFQRKELQRANFAYKSAILFSFQDT